ncbi:MAG: hypothetical protein AAGH41_10365 [Pseudomonadota bacterium]
MRSIICASLLATAGCGSVSEPTAFAPEPRNETAEPNLTVAGVTLADFGIGAADIQMRVFTGSAFLPLVEQPRQARAIEKHSTAALESSARVPRTASVSLAPDGAKGFARTNNGFVHEESGLRCNNSWVVKLREEVVTTLKLTDVTSFNRDSSDVVCAYASDDGLYSYALYATDWQDITVENHYALALRSMKQRYPKGELANVPVAMMRPKDVSDELLGETVGTALSFTNPDGTTGVTSVYITKVEDWHIKARATSNISNDPFLLWSTIVHQMNVLVVNQHQLDVKNRRSS